MVGFWRKLFGGSGPEPAGAGSTATPESSDAVAEPGPYSDIHLAMLPTYVRPGHGFVVTRDLIVDSLRVDGLDVGDPKATPHAYFTGGFRGYFNVPPGRHELVARHEGRESAWHLEMVPGAACVRCIDWGRGGWVDDEPETERHYQSLARSGSMLQAKALRPWPLASVYLRHAPEGAQLDGLPLRGAGAFLGVVNVAPGPHRVEAGKYVIRFTLPIESMQVVDFGTAPPTLVDPSLADLLVRTLLPRAPAGALVAFDSLLANVAHAASAAQASLDALEVALTGKGSVPTFDDSSLRALEDAFEACRRAPDDPAAAQAYTEIVRRHYIVDSEMAKQAPFFVSYAAAVLRHLRLVPSLARTPARTYLEYLAQDLQDIGDEAAAASGRELRALLATVQR